MIWEVRSLRLDQMHIMQTGDCVMESQKILKDIGFDGIYTFEKMKPEFHRF